MFATYGGFRRRVAVLMVLSLVASVLVAAAPVSAADDPKPSFGASFDACAGVEGSDFVDVPPGHANAEDIDCIAYYTITNGTSVTTYSPRSWVTREQMALFLMRLADRVKIDVPAAGATGFTDTGDLSTESQDAISQLAQLEITQGTSDTTYTYSPAANVTRGQMALFIARLMNKMTPMADGDIGLGSTTQYGHTPSDVADNDDDADIGSPYTDLGSAPKDEADAITELYELGVASGISATAYSPSSYISRASMAGFMAAVLDHSNARPAGLSIQATPSSSWGPGTPTVAVSMRGDRDDSFKSMEDQSVDVFSTTSANSGLRKDGTCNFGTNPDDDVIFGDFIDGDCVWDENDDATDANGNFFFEGDVAAGTTRVYYAWIGKEAGDKFDADTADEQTTSVTATPEQASLDVTSSINEHAFDAGEGKQVDLGADSTVTITVQLVDSDGSNVERSGIEIQVDYRQGDYINTNEATLETDDKGQVSYPVYGPPDNRRDDTQEQKDKLKFTSPGVTHHEDHEIDVHWIETDPLLHTAVVEAPAYVLAGNPSIGTTVRLYDQYGNPHRSNSNQKVEITLTPEKNKESQIAKDKDGNVIVGQDVRQVISRGYARWATRMKVSAGQTVDVQADVRRLARNSDSDPVKIDKIDKLKEWRRIDTIERSDITRQAEIDDLPTTYNDGKVVVEEGKTKPEYAKVDGIEGFLIDKPDTGQAVANITNKDALDLFMDEKDFPDAIAKISHVPSKMITRNNGTGDSEGINDVSVVNKASSVNVDVVKDIHLSLTGSNKFLTAELGDSTATLVYSYDSDDIFINSSGEEGIEVSMSTFERLIEEDNTQVEVLAYDVDGTSIFNVNPSHK